MKQAVLQLSYEEAVFRIEDEDLESSKFTGIIGQTRAMKILRRGTEITAAGYNVFVSGPPGTGRHTAVRKLLAEKTSPLWPRKDIALVFNFSHPENPRVLFFSPGRARQFKSDLHELVENLKKSIPASLETGNYIDGRDRLIEIIEGEENRLLSDFEKRIAEEGFHLAYADEESGGVMEIVPEYQGKPASFDVLQGKLLAGELDEKEWKVIRERYNLFVDELKNLYRELREARENLDDELEALGLETVMPVISAEISLLRDRYPGAEIGVYLDDLEHDLTVNLYLFTLDRELFDEAGNPRFIRYGVNILEDCSQCPETPVVWENHPTAARLHGGTNILGDGTGGTNFLQIRPGTMLKAGGGFLVLPAEELLRDEESRRLLKRYFQTGNVELRPPGIQPEPVSIDMRVIVIGTEEHYDPLMGKDPDFSKHFKLHAVFTDTTPRTPEATKSYAAFARRTADEGGLPEPDSSGVGALVEYGARLAGSRNRLSTRFSRIADCITAAGHPAETIKSLNREAVRAALEELRSSAAIAEEEIAEDILAGRLSIRLTGTESGRVTELALSGRGDTFFTAPSSVTAVVAPGRPGLVTIAGRTQSAEEVLEGYLRSRYAPDYSLSLYADIRLERRDGTGDGPPAAAASDICALLSALSEVPVRRNIAVAGGFSHTGEILPVEGITERVEGFFRICRNTGFGGEIGVILPRRNLDNLLIDRETGEALREGNLVLYAASTVDEAFTVLTGHESEELDDKVRNRLKHLSEASLEHPRCRKV